MWQQRLTSLALVLVVPVSARADPPVTTVWFGSPALSVELPSSDDTPQPEELARADVSEERAPAPCPGPVTVTRRLGSGRERMRMPLLDCQGHPREEALRALSVLARPRSIEHAPSDAEQQAWQASEGDPGLVAEDIPRLHPGLLERLQRIGEAFDPHPIEIISGVRPESPSRSRHHHGRALDVVVHGVPREALRDLAVTLPQTGVGWYPNSTFVHLDVREESAYWVDVSAPGEAPRYVASPEPPQETPAHTGAVEEGLDIDDALELIRSGVRVDAPDDAASLTPSERDDMRRETDEALRAIHVPTS